MQTVLTRATTAPTTIGTAHRVTMRDARAHFLAGGAVLVSEYGHELETPVTTSSTVHTRDRISWDALADMVTMWRGRYPNQRFYRVTYPGAVCTFPPVRVPVTSVQPGDVMPVLGSAVVEWVDRTSPDRVTVHFLAGSVDRFTRRPLQNLWFYADDLVHVSREVTA